MFAIPNFTSTASWGPCYPLVFPRLLLWPYNYCPASWIWSRLLLGIRLAM
jgi:hypothetical protein